MESIIKKVSVLGFILVFSLNAFAQKKDTVETSRIEMRIKTNDVGHKKYFKGKDTVGFTGVMVDRYPNSKKIKRIVELKDGIYADGPVDEYFENGNKKSEEYFLKGARNGKYKEWYENGKLKVEGGYVNDLEQGRWTYYKESGEKDYFNYYSKGVINPKAKK